MFYIWTVAASLLYLPLLLAPRQALIPFIRIWARGVLALMRVVVGIRLKIDGMEHLPPAPFIIAAKHQSAFETFALQLIVRDPAYILKRELTWLPFFGWYLSKAGAIAIDRSSGTKALKKMTVEAQQVKSEGRVIIVFPEGTRIAPGHKGKYHSGIAMLYGSLGIPVVPLALNSGLCWGKRAFKKHAGLITFRFLDPIAPGLDRKQFMAQLESSLETATEELLNVD
jgi:1-acyl-sn-glycerol-3-phosphate acyltransferase